MPLPEPLERLKDISIDTLGLSESTSALLKWNGLTHVLDCIVLFYSIVQHRGTATLWTRLFTLLFAEVKTRLIAAGYWDLVLDADVWQIFHQQRHHISMCRVVRWQGQEQDLYQIPFEVVGLSDPPGEYGRQFKSIGLCIDHFLYLLDRDAEYRREIHRLKDVDWTAQPPDGFIEFMFGMVQPRLAEMGLWAFVEAHLDDYIEDNRIDVEADEWDDDQDDWDDGSRGTEPQPQPLSTP